MSNILLYKTRINTGSSLRIYNISVACQTIKLFDMTPEINTGSIVLICKISDAFQTTKHFMI